MLKIVVNILLAVLNVLPDSPFQNALSENFLEPIEEIIPYINYFLPFDMAVKITASWLTCILLYYSWGYIKKFVEKFIIDKL